MCYPSGGGRLPTRYSPVRRCTPTPKGGFSLDLHVLGMPPALILSQDQTLQLNRESFPHADSLFSFQRANFSCRANCSYLYYKVKIAAVKRFFSGRSDLPSRAANLTVNNPLTPVKHLQNKFFSAPPAPSAARQNSFKLQDHRPTKSQSLFGFAREQSAVSSQPTGRALPGAAAKEGREF